MTTRRYKVSFPLRFETIPHPVFGMRPSLPSEVMYIDVESDLMDEVIEAIHRVVGDDWEGVEEVQLGYEGQNVIARVSSEGKVALDPSVHPLTPEALDMVTVLNGHQSAIWNDLTFRCSCTFNVIYSSYEDYLGHVAQLFDEYRRNK